MSAHECAQLMIMSKINENFSCAKFWADTLFYTFFFQKTMGLQFLGHFYKMPISPLNDKINICSG